MLRREDSRAIVRAVHALEMLGLSARELRDLLDRHEEPAPPYLSPREVNYGLIPPTPYDHETTEHIVLKERR